MVFFYRPRDCRVSYCNGSYDRQRRSISSFQTDFPRFGGSTAQVRNRELSLKLFIPFPSFMNFFTDDRTSVPDEVIRILNGGNYNKHHLPTQVISGTLFVLYVYFYICM